MTSSAELSWTGSTTTVAAAGRTRHTHLLIIQRTAVGLGAGGHVRDHPATRTLPATLERLRSIPRSSSASARRAPSAM